MYSIIEKLRILVEKDGVEEYIKAAAQRLKLAETKQILNYIKS